MGYIEDLRSLVGHRPVIVAGSAVLILDQQDRLLLQHRKDNDKWGLIGGSMEIGESMEETARREAFEETGLQLGELELFEVFSGKELIYEYPNGDVVANVTAVYIARSFTGELKVDKEEAHQARFFDANSLPSDLNPPDKPALNRFLQERSNAS